MNHTHPKANFELVDKLLNNISQAEALTEVAMSVEYKEFNSSVLFYYFLTIDNLLEEAITLGQQLLV